ncbi:unnamed protein product [Kluyveromyces dobzhanskii CBS 2104]|uniref:GPI mannosyltransferase 1 n=1 Tax=Kluyveromyces dobzhanskii CBS 2104 TaxID=1427455 RepID=A0A0A8L690_9SACH|nr:unnamed protein product [Kluyveromyces dobzhanskii CBS 2104]
MNRKVLYLLVVSLLLRIGFFCYGIYQDEHFDVKYTDIDYFVFHDGAGYVNNGQSPYLRDTYRYTPLLSWLLLPNYYFQWIHMGKVFFVLFDLLTGAMIIKLLQDSCKPGKQIALASLWLLNPIVITISTRGNAESVLCFLIMCALYFLKEDRFIISGLFYGLSIHLKIYPIIYALPIAAYVFMSNYDKRWFGKLFVIGMSTLVGLVVPTYCMYVIYGSEFIEQSYAYHFIRTDHRHNFSIWNLVLLLESAGIYLYKDFELARIAFVPQLTLCAAVTYLLWKSQTFENLLNVIFVQTYVFVTYNKVCTSQYFIWYIVLFPFYLANTTIKWRKGVFCLILWVISQVVWLSQAYLLEFKGLNVFFPNLFFGNAVFFLINVYLLGVFIDDIKARTSFKSNSYKKHV